MKQSIPATNKAFKPSPDTYPYRGQSISDPKRCYSELFKEHFEVRGNQLTFEESGVQYLNMEVAKIQNLSPEEKIAIHEAKKAFKNSIVTARIPVSESVPNWK